MLATPNRESGVLTIDAAEDIPEISGLAQLLHRSRKELLSHAAFPGTTIQSVELINVLRYEVENFVPPSGKAFFKQDASALRRQYFLSRCRRSGYGFCLFNRHLRRDVGVDGVYKVIRVSRTFLSKRPDGND